LKRLAWQRPQGLPRHRGPGTGDEGRRRAMVFPGAGGVRLVLRIAEEVQATLSLFAERIGRCLRRLETNLQKGTRAPPEETGMIGVRVEGGKSAEVAAD
ncbi:RNA recognition motif-containing protein, partial [Toxoplasma gondii ARI]